ncbi:hypothetical protein BOW35_07670 [Solemya velum gill symbiont]|uniref:DUF523 domain-containing protein n=1 Tax=Solemya velum gill symbiont TaxID=2340 RepID=UPI00099724D9|nr:DUF523 domain-containing protein [Solemya velum gill symbiont]OOZ15399.1 hypothetical protein BOW27_04185 [Solemya velum gill symbiont]OOZ17858.1 hypothetical protein BOW28_04350 [Solemya velum gill symbiont]OOZ19977.1 hypothetical protein BOW29_04185 [Solemya velum gill symbiont]OOZ22774.1 hypothetical protein BOW30_04510 [Solemya velum gill symbiont]OOZ24962.1 hypothetical protein BOW31_03980 [Solemya velum gill symbiont]
MKQKLILGVSSCLLGNPVRYDGNHKRNPYIADTLSDYFDFEVFCPETAIGLGVPRPPMQLYLDGNNTRLAQVPDSSIDLTQQMQAMAAEQCKQLGHLNGFILKSRSPSCGKQGVTLFDYSGEIVGSGAGLFAATLVRAFPSLPVEEETMLEDAALREDFIERVIAYAASKPPI